MDAKFDSASRNPLGADMSLSVHWAGEPTKAVDQPSTSQNSFVLTEPRRVRGTEVRIRLGSTAILQLYTPIRASGWDGIEIVLMGITID